MAAIARAAHEYSAPSCPSCGAALDLEHVASGVQACSACGKSFEATRFRPPERSAVVKRLAESGPAAETGCAAHPANVAAANCQRCGVFMCELCRIDADEMALCPACFDRLSSEGALPSTLTTYHDYGRQASNLALAGIPLMVFGLAIGPAAIYYGLRALKQLRQMGESSGRARARIAIAAGVLETGVGGLFIANLIRQAV